MLFCFADTVNFLGISIVGQTNKGGDGGIYVGSIMKGLVALYSILEFCCCCCYFILPLNNTIQMMQTHRLSLVA